MNRCTLVLFALAVAAAGPSGQSGRRPPVGGTLIDGYGGPPVRNSVILTDGERIRAVRQAGSLPVPPGVLIISTEGGWRPTAIGPYAMGPTPSQK